MDGIGGLVDAIKGTYGTRDGLGRICGPNEASQSINGLDASEHEYQTGSREHMLLEGGEEGPFPVFLVKAINLLTGQIEGPTGDDGKVVGSKKINYGGALRRGEGWLKDGHRVLLIQGLPKGRGGREGMTDGKTRETGERRKGQIDHILT